MYCPRCGQQQVSHNARFCSSCGFRLEYVAELIYSDGFLPANEPTPPEKGRSAKRRRMRQGAKLMFLSLVVALPICIGLSVIADDPGPLLFSFALFLAGLAWMLYFWLFGEEESPAAVQPQPQRYLPPQPRVSMPPSREAHITGSAARRFNTDDMAKPPSAADHTTKLFE